VADASNSYYKRGGGTVLDFYHVPSTTRVAFKAFLTGMTDSFQSTYNEEAVYGRMDPFQIYQGTKRRMSLAWQIPAYSAEEARENLRRCSLLASMLYPAYERSRGNAAAIKGTPIIKIKFANLIVDTSAGISGGSAADCGLAGAMSGLQINPVLDPGFVLGDEGGNQMLYPKLIELSCDFAVIHQHSLGWSGRQTRSDSKGNLEEGMNRFPYNLNNSVPAPTSPTQRYAAVDSASEARNAQAIRDTTSGKEEFDGNPAHKGSESGEEVIPGRKSSRSSARSDLARKESQPEKERKYKEKHSKGANKSKRQKRRHKKSVSLLKKMQKKVFGSDQGGTRETK